MQTSLAKYYQNHHIHLEAWESLMQGKIFEIDQLHDIAKKYNKTVAQIVLRWDIQNDVITIPKSTHPDRIKSNADTFDFELSSEDMSLINSLNKEERIGPDPDHITF